MSRRVIVNVATDSMVAGQNRLKAMIAGLGEYGYYWTNALPYGCPPHRPRGVCAANHHEDCVPYAFKAYAMCQLDTAGYTSILWMDACIKPIRSLEPIWEKIERDGAWICRNGWNNSEWTADSAYGDLFTDDIVTAMTNGYPVDAAFEGARQHNAIIPHVVATAFGLSTSHPTGRKILDEYFRLASTTKAFCGPWQNTNAGAAPAGRNADRPAGPCGPPTTLGHRHDQTALSVLAWRYGVALDNPPSLFAYYGGETDTTVLVADGDLSR